jgi:hypothetical protein
MLTINADDHPFMRNYHKPEDEKRMDPVARAVWRLVECWRQPQYGVIR